MGTHRHGQEGMGPSVFGEHISLLDTVETNKTVKKIGSAHKYTEF
jgi:hypothetical protein